MKKKKFSRLPFIKAHIKKSALSALLMLCILDTQANETTYYLDKINGNDSNDGHSVGKAWKTLEKLNTASFEQGDKILLKRGQLFTGSLYLTGNGTVSQPIVLGAYGTGKRPIISSAGFYFSLQLMDASGWEVSDIETMGSEKAGIFIGCTKENIRMDYFRITNCYVHDIGDTLKLDWEYSKSTGGIIVVNGNIGKEGKPVFFNSVFNDVVINNCTVRYNHRWTCLSISSGKIDGKGGNANYIKNCTAEYSAADGIRMNGVQNSFIEYCVMYRNGAWPNYPGKNLGGLGAWFFDAENCTIQFCEASHVQAATTDGGAFDIDYWQKNSTVQYCYGHDCSGYGVSVFGAEDPNKPTENSIVRYNIFSNNGRDSSFAWQGDFFVYTWAGGLLNGVKIYNNTSYWNPVVDTPAVKIDADFTGTNQNIFTNNIIYSKKKQLAYLKNDTMQCNNNIYWVAGNGTPAWKRKDKTYHSLTEWQQNTGQEKHSYYIDPMLINPGYHDRNFPVTQFKLEKGSPAINTGVFLEGMGNRDFFGNTIPDKSGKYDIGAHEYGSNKNKQEHKKIGSTVSSFELPGINNTLTSLSAFSGNTVLLSFIDINNPQDAQSQLPFIKSMNRQYAVYGLKIVLIDESSVRDDIYRNEMLINFIEDNELNNIAVLIDNKKENIAAKYGATKFPATFLISKDGIIQKQWQSPALSSEMAMAIENDLGDVLAVKHFDTTIAQQD